MNAPSSGRMASPGIGARGDVAGALANGGSGGDRRPDCPLQPAHVAGLRFWLWMLVPLRLLVMPLIVIALPVLPNPPAVHTQTGRRADALHSQAAP